MNCTYVNFDFFFYFILPSMFECLLQLIVTEIQSENPGKTQSKNLKVKKMNNNNNV